MPRVHVATLVVTIVQIQQVLLHRPVVRMNLHLCEPRSGRPLAGTDLCAAVESCIPTDCFACGVSLD